jgi:hypothetical protein
MDRGKCTTARIRTGFGKFTFPADKPAGLLFRTSTSETGSEAATVHIDPATQTVSGSDDVLHRALPRHGRTDGDQRRGRPRVRADNKIHTLSTGQKPQYGMFSTRTLAQLAQRLRPGCPGGPRVGAYRPGTDHRFPRAPTTRPARPRPRSSTATRAPSGAGPADHRRRVRRVDARPLRRRAARTWRSSGWTRSSAIRTARST